MSNLLVTFGQWQVILDTNSQRHYFSNGKESVWECPTEIKNLYDNFISNGNKSEEVVEKEEAGELYRNDQWVAAWDDNYKRAYFINIATNQSQWECPNEIKSQVDQAINQRNKPKAPRTPSQPRNRQQPMGRGNMQQQMRRQQPVTRSTTQPARHKTNAQIQQEQNKAKEMEQRRSRLHKPHTICNYAIESHLHRKVIHTFSKEWKKEFVKVNKFRLTSHPIGQRGTINVDIFLIGAHVTIIPDYKNHSNVFEVSDRDEKNKALFECISIEAREQWIECLILNGCKLSSKLLYSDTNLRRNKDKRPQYIEIYADRIDCYKDSQKGKKISCIELTRYVTYEILKGNKTLIIRNSKSKLETSFTASSEIELEKILEKIYQLKANWYYSLFNGYLLNGINRSAYYIPRIVYETCKFLELYGLNQVGLFRVPGSSELIQKLKKQYSQDIDNIKLNPADVHSVAGVLKLYFRSLAEPLIPAKAYKSLTSLNLNNAKGDQEQKITYLKECITFFPKENKLCLNVLIRLLTKVSANSEVNQMGAKNCAMVFAPGLFRKPSTYLSRFPNANAFSNLTSDGIAMAEDIAQCEAVLKVMIEKYDELFEVIEYL